MRAYLLIGSYATIQSDAQSLQNKPPPFGTLDIPADGSSVQGNALTIQGWALDNRTVSQVIARIDEDTEYTLDLGGSRPDVDQAWPGYLNGENSGFQGSIDVSSLHHAPNCGHRSEYCTRQ